MKKRCPACCKKLDVSEFYMQDGKPKGYCKRCHKKKHKEYSSKPENALRIRASRRKWSRTNQVKDEAGRRLRREELRESFLLAYGSKCSCCGETEKDFLTLEHVNKDGAGHRKKFGGGLGVYRDLRRRGWPKSGYTLLCMNCNWATRDGKICPHKIHEVKTHE